MFKDAGKADRKQVQQKQAVVGKDKKLSIHERLEINKRIIQEKQGKDKPERGDDRGCKINSGYQAANEGLWQNL